MRMLLIIVLVALLYGFNSNRTKDDSRRSKWWDEDNK